MQNAGGEQSDAERRGVAGRAGAGAGGRGLTQSGTVHFADGGGLSAAKWWTLEAPGAAVADNPSFWVDACALTNAGVPGVVVENGTNFVVLWNDVRGTGYNFATNITPRPMLRLNDINGLPSVSFKRVAAVPSLSEALFWDQPMNDIRAVFRWGRRRAAASCWALRRRRTRRTFIVAHGSITDVLFSTPPARRARRTARRPTAFRQPGRHRLQRLLPTGRGLSDRAGAGIGLRGRPQYQQRKRLPAHLRDDPVQP